MSSVCDLGTIRNIIRGVEAPSPHTLISEMIDDAEHSDSTQIFIDINTHDKEVIFGFDQPATEDQLSKMVQWNPVSDIHSSNNISTCGQGLKYYEFRFRGKQIHATKHYHENGKPFYMISNIESDIIYDHAASPDVSESLFSEILRKKTFDVQTKDEDEVDSRMIKIFSNEDNMYPFTPKTIVISKKITNEQLLRYFNDDFNIENLEKELINKYYEEIKMNKIQIFIKFPKDNKFRELGITSTIDVIGSTIKVKQHVTEIYYVNNDIEANKLKKGEYIPAINGTFLSIRKQGNSCSRTSISISKSDMKNILLLATFTQYMYYEKKSEKKSEKDDDKSKDDIKAKEELKKAIATNSLEDYSGVYLKIGNKFIDGKPVPSSLTKRNLQGNMFYRGIIQLMNPKETKMMLGIHGLKSDFNLSTMRPLEEIIKQCTIIYKNFCAKYKDNYPFPLYSDKNPLEYCEVKTTNQKSEKTSKPGNNYIRKIGKNFYKFGYTLQKGREERIFGWSQPDIDAARNDFPEEEIYDYDKCYYEYLSPEVTNSASIEQLTKEFLMTLQDVTMYEHKAGGEVREYFHCDNIETLENIKKFMINGFMQ
jgi:hypothetical protein